VAELLARAEAADQAEVIDGMSIPDELARREQRLAKLAEACANYRPSFRLTGWSEEDRECRARFRHPNQVKPHFRSSRHA
jgi:hypothetical protein